MAIKISGTDVIDNSRVLQNITGANGIYTNFHATLTSIDTVLNFSTPMMQHTLSANATFSESNKAAGKSALFLLDTSSVSHTPTFSSNIKWKENVTPTWGDYRYWQIALVCIDTTTVRGVAKGYESTSGGAGSAPVEISNQTASNFSLAGIGGTATAKYKLDNAGLASRTNNSGTYVNISGEWLISGSASDYEARMTTGTPDPFSGSYTTAGSSAFDTWLSLGTTREWVMSATNTFALTTNTLEIRYAANSAIIDTATITFTVDSAP